MNFKPKTVLIVDDDEGMRDTLNAILRRDYRVLRAASGEAALAILNREDVDLMLLDVRLPGIDGFDVLRIVKENYSLVEVIMISAITEIETAVKAMKVGAYHYATKDFDYEALRSLVGNVNWFLPSRTEDGYGLSSATVERLARAVPAWEVTFSREGGLWGMLQAIR